MAKYKVTFSALINDVVETTDDFDTLIKWGMEHDFDAYTVNVYSPEHTFPLTIGTAYVSKMIELYERIGLITEEDK